MVGISLKAGCGEPKSLRRQSAKRNTLVFITIAEIDLLTVSYYEWINFKANNLNSGGEQLHIFLTLYQL